MASQLSAFQRAELEQLIQDHQSWAGSLQSPPVAVRLLSDGLSNTALLLRGGTERWVIRFGSSHTPLGTNFEREILVHTAASCAGIAPRIAFANADTKLLVTEYVDRADTLPADTRAVAGLLRRIHAIELSTESLNPSQRVGEFRKLLSSDHWLYPLFDEHSQSLEALCAAGACPESATQALCHNDLLLANRRWNAQLIAIDWEYACTGDPLFDIAVCSSELPPADRSALLRRYFDRELQADEYEKIKIYEQLYQILAVLWAAVYAPHSIAKLPTDSLLKALKSGEQYR